MGSFPKITECGFNHYSEYNEKHDAYFCKECDVWLEKLCSDKACYFCTHRPEKPSGIKMHIDKNKSPSYVAAT